MTIRKKAKNPRIQFLSATPGRWKDFENLFGARGACGGCWCMNWRLLRPDFDAQKGAKNKRAIRKIIESGEQPGIIGYLNEEPVIWCSIAPREQFPRMEKAPTLKRVDDKPVWSITCLYMVKRVRRLGLASVTLKAAVEFAKLNGARIIEGYPFEPGKSELPDPFVWTGMVSSYIKAGFKEVARHRPTRPIMRKSVHATRS